MSRTPPITIAPGLALALASLGGNAAHIRHIRNALNDQHVPRQREIVGLELGHLVGVGLGAVERVHPLENVPHRQCGADNHLAWDGWAQHRRADDAGRNTDLVHGVGNDPAGVAKCQKPGHHSFRRARHAHVPDLFPRNAPGQPFFARVHGHSLTRFSRFFVRSGYQLVHLSHGPARTLSLAPDPVIPSPARAVVPSIAP